MSDTKVTGGSPERASQLAEEVVDMLNSIRAVKGKDYADAIIGIFTLNNLIGILVIDNTHMQAQAGLSAEEFTVMNIPAVEFIDLIVDTMAGITTQLAVGFVTPYEGKEEYEARHMAKSKEMMTDIRMLLSKQDEYNERGKGK